MGDGAIQSAGGISGNDYKSNYTSKPTKNSVEEATKMLQEWAAAAFGAQTNTSNDSVVSTSFQA